MLNGIVKMPLYMRSAGDGILAKMMKILRMLMMNQ